MHVLLDICYWHLQLVIIVHACAAGDSWLLQFASCHMRLQVCGTDLLVQHLTSELSAYTPCAMIRRH